jgi:hypothetical protein
LYRTIYENITESSVNASTQIIFQVNDKASSMNNLFLKQKNKSTKSLSDFLLISSGEVCLNYFGGE